MLGALQEDDHDARERVLGALQFEREGERAHPPRDLVRNDDVRGALPCELRADQPVLGPEELDGLTCHPLQASEGHGELFPDVGVARDEQDLHGIE